MSENLPHSAALPFSFKRGSQVVGIREIVTTTEVVHGLLRLDGDRLVFQWRAARSSQRVGSEIRTDEEVDPVREVIVPLAGLAGAELRRRWSDWPPGLRLIITASDLRAFEELAGSAGLRLAHPAQFVLRIGRNERLAAHEFASELELAVAERQLRAAEQPQQLEGPPSS